MAITENEFAGACPKCGKHNLVYEVCVNDAEYLYHPYTCKDCDFSGKEWYTIEFYEHTD